ncbi:MAG: DUF4124 domain-containing protein [Proteobacteria bacterium]|nr:DUF4124 domain-containing protein [Pseudomonadota bacterium]
MKDFFIVVVILVITQSTYASEIYKYTDADGNIHYSEVKPFADVKEADLKGVKTMKATAGEAKPKWKHTRQRGKYKTTSNFEDFSILSPTENQVVTSIDKNITVMVNLSSPLPTKYRIKFFVDDLPRGKVKSDKQLIADVEQGEHTVYAQVIEAHSRKIISTTPTITFYVK